MSGVESFVSLSVVALQSHPRCFYESPEMWIAVGPGYVYLKPPLNCHVPFELSIALLT